MIWWTYVRLMFNGSIMMESKFMLSRQYISHLLRYEIDLEQYYEGVLVGLITKSHS